MYKKSTSVLLLTKSKDVSSKILFQVQQAKTKQNKGDSQKQSQPNRVRDLMCHPVPRVVNFSSKA